MKRENGVTIEEWNLNKKKIEKYQINSNKTVEENGQKTKKKKTVSFGNCSAL